MHGHPLILLHGKPANHKTIQPENWTSNKPDNQPTCHLEKKRIPINLDYFISGNPFSWLTGHPTRWTYSLFSIFPNGWMSIQILKEIFFVLKSKFFWKFLNNDL